ncbi:unnamed protein product [Cyclocybe aegerita]|uniref:Uncharacterized protein n=1 Tax=Cyclocybe aegerita TaxID=1973307 RepID=A0A8S0W7S9_CYCAE|nr:unnamed protein product [Cyclocybe aegerita]
MDTPLWAPPVCPNSTRALTKHAGPAPSSSPRRVGPSSTAHPQPQERQGAHLYSYSYESENEHSPMILEYPPPPPHSFDEVPPAAMLQSNSDFSDSPIAIAFRPTSSTPNPLITLAPPLTSLRQTTPYPPSAHHAHHHPHHLT